MEELKKKQILKPAARDGELMMKSGAEVTRVEDTIERICTASGVDHVEVYAVPTGVFLSIEPDQEDGGVLTYIRRLHNNVTDLKKIHELNRFSRTFATTSMTVKEGLEELERIDSQPPYPLPLQLFGAALAAGMFGAIYSGNVLTTVLTALVTVVCELVYRFFGRLGTNYFIKGMVCCGTAALLAVFLKAVGLIPGIGAVVIGVLMLYTPGAALTNSIRDLLSGDILSGLTRLAEAVLIALSLATGVGIVLKIWTMAGTQPSADAASLPLAVTVLLGTLSVPGFSILFHAPGKCILPATITGGAGWLVWQLCTEYGQGAAVSVFFGAFMVGGFSRIFAKTVKAPGTAFIIPGIIPLVPGALTFYTMQAFFLGQVDNGLTFCLHTVSSAGAIALGLLAVGAAAQIVHQIHHQFFRSAKSADDDPDDLEWHHSSACDKIDG
jgi:uncharacterized membrane protein YjjP (DUF1212 family)